MNPSTDKTEYSISVVIPAYNAEKYIRRAIDSVLNQTLPPDEIIVVDDGSTDNTAKIVKAFPQIIYIYQENAGVSAACNTGIQKARCRWVAFLDSDDVWLPEKLQLQMSLLQRNPNLKWVMCNYYFNDCQRNKKFIYFDPSKARQLMDGRERFNFFDGVMAGIGWARCCTVVERNALKEAGFFRPGYSAAEDLDLWVRVAFIHPEIGFVDLPAAHYNFRREGSISSQSFINLVKARCQNLEWLLELSEKYGKRKAFEPAAGKLLAGWIDGLLGKGSAEKLLIEDVLRRFNRLLPKKYKIEVRLKTMFPRMAGFIFNLYFKLKKTLGLSKNK